MPAVPSVPALMVCAPGSGHGKTTVTAALARALGHEGSRVRVFKVGPDFLDPMILERASGAPVYQLDLWMCGEADCLGRLHAAATEADVILLEGVMGLYDGEPSTAELARRLGVPVLPVIDASAMAQTFGAIVEGLARYDGGVELAGVVANRVGGAGHAAILREALPGDTPLVWLPQEPEVALPERHLGLVQAAEMADLDARLERAAEMLVDAGLPPLARGVAFPAPPPEPAPRRRLDGLRIAVAHDEAFAFCYRANLELLEALGAEIVPVSPLADPVLPAVDALYLPGGYPELHIDRLASNRAFRASVAAHHAAGRPLVAECGGLLYLVESLTDVDGRDGDMVGVLCGQARMQPRLSAIGPQQARLDGGVLRGHTFHHSALETALEPLATATSPLGGSAGEPVYRQGRLTASYVHWYFPSAPEVAAGLFA